MELPTVVSPAEWQAALDDIRAKENAETQRRGALAAERRHLPIARIEKDHVLGAPDGTARLLDLFDGRSQSFAGQIGHPAHLHARDISFALVSRAPIENLEVHRRRMDRAVPAEVVR